MNIASLIRLTTIVLPMTLGACSDAVDDLWARDGDSPRVAESFTATAYERGRYHFAAGRYGLAVEQFEAALAEDSESIEALNGLAAAFDRLRRFDQAERFYLRALSLDPSSGQTLNNLGYSYLMQHRYDIALNHLREAQKLDPANPQIAANVQQAEAGMDLGSRTFVASPMDAGSTDQPISRPRTTLLQTAATPVDAGRAPQTVQIRALAARGPLWVETTRSSVQTLITQPRPEVLAAARNVGVAPQLLNYQLEASLAVLPTQRTPWEATRATVGDVPMDMGPDEAALQAPLFADATPLSAGVMQILAEDPVAVAAIDIFSGSALAAPMIEVVSRDPVAGGTIEGDPVELPPIVRLLSAAVSGAPEGEMAAGETGAFAKARFQARAGKGPAVPSDTAQVPAAKVPADSDRLQIAYLASGFLVAEDPLPAPVRPAISH